MLVMRLIRNLVFLKENLLGKLFLKNTKNFTEIKERLVEFSKKIGLSVENEKLVSRIQKGERVQIAKKKWLKLT